MNEMTIILGGRYGEMGFRLDGQGKVIDCTEGLWHLLDTWVLDFDKLQLQFSVRLHIKKWNEVAKIDGYIVKDIRKRY